MNENLDQLLNGEREPGLYRIPADVEPEAVQAAAEEHGWRYFYVDGAKVQDKASFLEATGAALDFPDYSGRNWDAFEESIRDLSWTRAPGYMLVYDDPDVFAKAQPQQWETALSILQTAVESWAAEGAPMVVLFRKAGRSLPEVPWL